jgi:hypothetical protein
MDSTVIEILKVLSKKAQNNKDHEAMIDVKEFTADSCINASEERQKFDMNY